MRVWISFDLGSLTIIVTANVGKVCLQPIFGIMGDTFMQTKSRAFARLWFALLALANLGFDSQQAPKEQLHRLRNQRRSLASLTFLAVPLL